MKIIFKVPIALVFILLTASCKNNSASQTTVVSDYPHFGTHEDILMEGVYHRDEINVQELESLNLKWMSLQETSLPNVLFLKWDAPIFELVYDPAVDNSYSKTGVKVTFYSNYLDNSTKFIFSNRKLFFDTNEGYDGYQVEIADVPRTIFPDKPHKFTYKDVDYTLIASADKEEGGGYSNYELILKMEKNGKITSQILVFQSYPDAMSGVEILMVGDIDNDGIIDLLIDTTTHYMMSIPTLYLSSLNTSKNAIVKISAYREILPNGD